jgi:hypothetical protein
MKSLSCPNRHCHPSGKGDVGAIIRHGFYKTRWESIVATSARLVERRSAQQPRHLIIDSNTVAPRLMKSPPSVSKV